DTVGLDEADGVIVVIDDGQELGVVEHTHTRVALRVGVCDLQRVVGAAIVDDAVTPVAVALREHALDALAQVLAAVVDRRDHAHQGYAHHTFHGQSPRASMRSKVILSLNVSMRCKKPPQGNVPSLRAATSRTNGCSISSPPAPM